MGMAIGDARWCAHNAAAVMRYYAGAVDKFFGSTIPVDRDGIVLTFREPIGVAALITPWNFPLNIGNWKTAPAIAAGNTVVLKPASLSPSPSSATRSSDWRRPPARRPQRPPRAGPRSATPRRAPARRQGRLHGLDRGRDRDRTEGGRDGEAGHPRARWQERMHRLRRRRSREGGTHGAVLGVREREAGLLRALAPPGRGVGEGRAPRALRRRDPRDRRRRPGGRGHADGAARLRGAARDGRGVRRAGARRRARAPRGRDAAGRHGARRTATTSAPRSSTVVRTRWSSRARRSSGRSSR